VLAARIRVKEALQEYGVTSDSVQQGDNATWSSGFHELSPKQKEMVSSMRGCCSSRCSNVGVGSGQTGQREGMCGCVYYTGGLVCAFA
jgi:hypothetical protein